MDDFSITQDGKPLDESKYIIDVEGKIFGSLEGNLVLDFSGLYGWAFKTGRKCTFKASIKCTFMTRWGCTFNTRSYCTFNTGHGCTFDTGSACTFQTDDNCTFDTGNNCTFHTGNNCTFKTWGCGIFSVRDIKNCKFEYYDGKSIILDRESGQRYVLNEELKKILKMMKG